MPRVTFDIETGLSSERLISMLTDFSPRRPDLWPMLAPTLFEVYRVEANSAYVKKGVSIRPGYGSAIITSGQRIGYAGPYRRAIIANPEATSR